MVKQYIAKPCLFTKKQIDFINGFCAINDTKFATELRAILDDYIDYVESDKLHKCPDCRFQTDHEKQIEGKQE